jgi:hypothetical protein
MTVKGEDVSIMSEHRKVDDHRSDDDFERVATRGFVRLGIAGLELRLAREMARSETRLWWKVSATVGVFVVFGTVVQLLAG